jgi:hypothetical protein
VRITRVRRLSILLGSETAPQPVYLEMIPDCTGDGVRELAIDTSEQVTECDVKGPPCDRYEAYDVVRRYVVDGVRTAQLGTLTLGGSEAPNVATVTVDAGGVNS